MKIQNNKSSAQYALYKAKKVCIIMFIVIAFGILFVNIPSILFYYYTNLADHNLNTKEEYSKTENIYKQLIYTQKSFLYIDNNIIARSYELLGLFYENQNRYQEAESAYYMALNIRKKLKTNSKISEDLINLANINLKLNNYKLAEKYFKENLILLEKYKHNETNYAIMSLFEAQEFYNRLGKYDDLENLLEKRLKINKPQVNWKLYLDVAKLRKEYNQLTKAEKIYNQILESDFKHSKTFFIIDDYYNVYSEYAELKQLQKKYNEAEVLYKKSLELSRKNYGYNSLESIIILEKLRHLYLEQKNLINNTAVLIDLINRTKKCVNSSVLINDNALNKCTYQHFKYLGIFYQELGELGHAESFYNKALFIVSNENINFKEIERANILELKGQLYKRQKRFDDAEKSINQSIAIKNSTDSPRIICAYDELLELYKMRGKKEKLTKLKQKKQILLIKNNFLKQINNKLYCSNY